MIFRQPFRSRWPFVAWRQRSVGAKYVSIFSHSLAIRSGSLAVHASSDVTNMAYVKKLVKTFSQPVWIELSYSAVFSHAVVVFCFILCVVQKDINILELFFPLQHQPFSVSKRSAHCYDLAAVLHVLYINRL